MNAHDFSFPGLAGGEIRLADMEGKAILVVNTASECGFTPQYAGLESLWRRYRDRGLVVLGVPSNDFGQQEPGDEAAIGAFCKSNYGVTFPLAAKQKVLGAAAHPFYRWIEAELGEGGAPRWNFHKFLIAPDGSLADAFPSRVTPESAQLTGAVEALLGGG